MSIRNDLRGYGLQMIQPLKPIDLSVCTFVWHWYRCYESGVDGAKDMAKPIDWADLDRISSTAFFNKNANVFAALWFGAEDSPRSYLDIEFMLKASGLMDERAFIAEDYAKAYSAYSRLYYTTIRRVWLMAEKVAAKYVPHGTVTRRWEMTKDLGIQASAFNPFLSLVDAINEKDAPTSPMEKKMVYCMLATLPDPFAKISTDATEFYGHAVVPDNYGSIMPIVNPINSKDLMEMS